MDRQGRLQTKSHLDGTNTGETAEQRLGSGSFRCLSKGMQNITKLRGTLLRYVEKDSLTRISCTVNPSVQLSFPRKHKITPHPLSRPTLATAHAI
ncbi:unnamed protein product [Pieris brassicae]|uniref:Uncharacterized protein n=1 Tax=Pieris brassicae TaxID=7116 RepID=A0A9P0X4S6_PIEBR|nr:unnamed protein product [Pieris brassicae]